MSICFEAVEILANPCTGGALQLRHRADRKNDPSSANGPRYLQTGDGYIGSWTSYGQCEGSFVDGGTLLLILSSRRRRR